MAVDLGLARTGLAISDPSETLASPLGTIPERKEDRLLQRVAACAAEQGAQAVVVGYPRNMDGSRGESARRAEAFAQSLEEVSGLPVTLWDERLTTVSAQSGHRHGSRHYYLARLSGKQAPKGRGISGR